MTTTARRRTGRMVACLAAVPLAIGIMIPAAASAADTAPADGLVASYDFSETSGTILTDSATANGAQNGTVMGGAAWNNGVMSFTGANYVKLPDNLLAGRTAASVVVEVKPSAGSLTGGNFMWNLGGSGNAKTGQFFVHTPGHRVSISKTNYTAEQTVVSPSAFRADQWQSVTATIAPNSGTATSTITFYVDGVQVGQKTDSNTNLADLTTQTSNFIAASAYSADAKFTGQISSFRVYDRALSASEVLSIAQGDATTSAAETLAGIDLGDLDRVTADLALSTSGGVTWTSSDTAVVEADGTVHRAEDGDRTATLTATASVRGQTTSRTFTATVVKLPNAAERQQEDLDAISLRGTDDVRDNLTLPTEGSIYGSEVTWTATPAGVISTEQDGERAPGMVTRPGYGKQAATVTLTAHSGSASRDFTLTVPALPKAEDKSAYMFAHFTAGRSPGASNEQIYFASSEDGVDWTDLNDEQPVLTSTVGETGARDPFLVRAPGGDRYYLIATDLSTHLYGWHFTPDNPGSKSLVVWESDDLVNWSEPRLVDVASKIPQAGAAWAPEATYDPNTGQYMVYWATASGAGANDPLGNSLGDYMNMYYATTRDFVTFSDPVKWIDREMSIIDTTMIEVDGTFYRASGDGEITIEASTDPYAVTVAPTALEDNPGGWEKVGTLNSIFGNPNYSGKRLEGPEIFQYTEDDWATDDSGEPVPTWGVIADRYNSGQGYMPFRTTDLSSTSAETAGGAWSVGSDIHFGNVLKRHGSIVPITQSEYNRLQVGYGDGVAAEAELAVTARRVAGKLVLVTSVKNITDAPIDVNVSTDYGSKQIDQLPPGRTVSSAFSTRQASIPAGTVTVETDSGLVETAYDAVN